MAGNLAITSSDFRADVQHQRTLAFFMRFVDTFRRTTHQLVPLLGKHFRSALASSFSAPIAVRSDLMNECRLQPVHDFEAA